MTFQAPGWSEGASPQIQGYHGNNVTSPSNSSNYSYGSQSPQNQGYYGNNVTSPSNSDNNYYESPAVSPGNWNVPSPYGGSIQSYPSPDTSFQGSENGSTPPATPSSVSSSSSHATHNELDLPSELGRKPRVEKNELHRGRERAVNNKALMLIEQNFGAENKPQPRTPLGPGGPGMSAREAAIMRYKSQKKLEAVGLKAGQKFQTAPKLLAISAKSREKLASSTRKKKKTTPEEDYETISDFKCQLDRDREKWAQKQALSLLYSLSGCA